MNSSPAPSVPPLASKRNLWRAAYRRVRGALALLGLFFLIHHLFFDLSQITSPSMSPTLRGTGPDNGDWVLSERITYKLRRPRRWELVEFWNGDGIRVMKRVTGLPGEHVKLQDGQLVIDGKRVPPPSSLAFLYYFSYGPKLHNGASADCGSGYFVLGDDSKDSEDSRYEGPVDASRVRVRPWLIVWPPSRFGFVNP
jgi:signal peptidase I